MENNDILRSFTHIIKKYPVSELETKTFGDAEAFEKFIDQIEAAIAYDKCRECVKWGGNQSKYCETHKPRCYRVYRSSAYRAYNVMKGKFLEEEA
jgi:hypothetical protein